MLKGELIGGDDGNVGIIRSPVRAIASPDRNHRSMLSTLPFGAGARTSCALKSRLLRSMQ